MRLQIRILTLTFAFFGLSAVPEVDACGWRWCHHCYQHWHGGSGGWASTSGTSTNNQPSGGQGKLGAQLGGTGATGTGTTGTGATGTGLESSSLPSQEISQLKAEWDKKFVRIENALKDVPRLRTELAQLRTDVAAINTKIEGLPTKEFMTQLINNSRAGTPAPEAPAPEAPAPEAPAPEVPAPEVPAPAATGTQ